MKCIVRSLKEFKALENIYGTDLAEKFVHDYSVVVRKVGPNDEYYYPTPKEVKDWLTNDKQKVRQNVMKAFEVNPFLTDRAIQSLLSGVIHPLKGKYYVTRGFTNYGSIVEQKAAEELIFKPNVAIVEALADKFPSVISLSRSERKAYTVEVVIKPLADRIKTTEEQDEEEVNDFNENFAADPETQKKEKAKEIAVRLGDKFAKAFGVPYTMISAAEATRVGSASKTSTSCITTSSSTI
jgi:hypothetical protein